LGKKDKGKYISGRKPNLYFSKGSFTSLVGKKRRREDSEGDNQEKEGCWYLKLCR
jgi:hypothetical protein